MKKTPMILGVLLILSSLVAGCSNLNATLTPYPTYTPHPTYTPYPTPKSQVSSFTDLFCEYSFCIGHPSELYLKDPYSLDETENWSSYKSGILAGILDDQVVIKWRIYAKAAWDSPLRAKEVLISDHLPVGDTIEEKMGDSMVAYVETKNRKPDSLLPYGVSAAWYCGDRGFQLLIATRREGRAVTLLKTSLERFTCVK